MNLKKHGVEAVILMSTESNSEKNDVQRRMRAMAEGRTGGGKEIKLCYVTAGKLARFVVDEAHGVSQDGHDFRPDYGKLHNLRTQYPSVPIMVLDDSVEVLRLEKPVVSGEDALTKGTVYCTAPLYCKNLHYKVIPKPNKGQDVYQAMVNWILEKHKGKSGIVYCFSRGDAETVAEKIQALSENQIRTGTYHANVRDDAMHQT